MTAKVDVDVEDSFQTLPPGHGGPAFGGRAVFMRLRHVGLVALAPFGWRHLRTVRAFGV